jgi:hypothetical protein
MATSPYKIVLFFSIFSTLIIGCSPVYYQPTTMNTPNFKQATEVYLAVNTTGFMESLKLGGDVQAAYAVSDHFFVQGNYMLNFQNHFGKLIDSEIKNQSGEIAGGYFSPLPKNWLFSLCGGYGIGNVRNNFSTAGTSTANLTKSFIQPSLGFRHENFEFIASAKYANLKYANLYQDYKNQEYIDQLRFSLPLFYS